MDRIKGPWSPEEDESLTRLVQQHGPRNWSLICKSVPGRSGKSCRLRWCNQLSPQVEHRAFTPDEDDTIVRAHAKFGNKWATIARLLSGRTDNAIKNHWNSTLKRKWSGEGGFEAQPHKRSAIDGSGLNVSGHYLIPGSPSGSDVSDSSPGLGLDGPFSDPATSLSLSLPGKPWVDVKVLGENVEAAGRDSEMGGVELSPELVSVMKEMIRAEVMSYMRG